MSEKTDELGSPLKTIRAHCLDCSGTAHEVELCPCVSCKLYAYRFGHDPRREKRTLTDEQRQIMRERFARKNSPLDKGEISEESTIKEAN